MRSGVFARIVSVNASNIDCPLEDKGKTMFTWPNIRSIFDANIFFITPDSGSHPDENFYPDEEQVAAELAVPLPGGLAPQPLPDVAPDEFEKLFGWFLS